MRLLPPLQEFEPLKFRDVLGNYRVWDGSIGDDTYVPASRPNNTHAESDADSAPVTASLTAGLTENSGGSSGSGKTPGAGLTLEATTGSSTVLQLGMRDTGSYGNNFAGKIDTDGIVNVSFAGTGQDLLLSFDGYDIDFDDEVEVYLNGTSLGFLQTGVDLGLVSYQFEISAEQQQEGENVISFVQARNVNFTWGVTDILLETVGPATALETGVADTNRYGNNFAGTGDADGTVSASFSGTGQDLLLSFDGYDIDFNDEVEVLLNGSSLGFLDAGVNNGLSSYQFEISADQQQAGENVISFVQSINVDFAWGVTDILLETAGPATSLEIGVTDTGSYGNNFAGFSDADGVVSASFTGTGQDLLLSFDGYDIDFADEVEVLLNGASLGFLEPGVNNGLSSHEFFISADQQLADDNIISFVQNRNVNFTWGVTDILLDTYQPDAATPLAFGFADTSARGNNFNGSTDIDGRVDMSFTATGQNLLLSFDGYDIDFDDEVEVLLNGNSLGFLDAGVNNGLSSYQFEISAAQQQDGENIISFVQQLGVNWTWGVTDILLEATDPVATLEIGVTDTGSYGNRFAGMSDADGVVSMSFADTGQDLLLTFDGYDIDFDDEVEVLLNGASLGYLNAGVNNAFSSYEFFVSADQQQAGENIISFVQRDYVTNIWGVTDILLDGVPEDAPIALELSTLETGVYGNNFEGARNYDGTVDAIFTSTGEDLTLKFSGYDVDYNDEIEVLLNGNSLGFLDAGVNNGLSSYQFDISAAQQQDGENVISFVQRQDVRWTWGITDISLDVAPASFTPVDPGYTAQWHLHEIGLLERVWADYTGDGVAVGIYDDGIQYSHHDLNDNYDASKHVTVNGKIIDPADGSGQHGTAVAGVIAAEADGVGAVGVAFGAGITGVNVFSGAADPNKPSGDVSGFTEAMMQMADFDVVNHSWGWSPPFTPDSPPKDTFYASVLPTLENAAVNGRDGLGTVMVKSAGNADSNAQGELLDVSRFTVNVGATDNDGDVAWYSNQGANLLLTAPSSGDAFLNLGIMTTDLLGASGYASGDYTGTDGFTGFGGTSSAAPVVSGVAALMLEANPELGWRDVHDILAYSATHTGTAIDQDPLFFLSEQYTWRFNGADNWNGGGLHVSEDYGYGNVDAFNAVRMAEIWHLFDTAQTSANEAHVTQTGSPGQSIGTGASFDIDMTGVALNVDYAELSLSLNDSTVDIFLSSAEGTQVELYRSGDAPAGALEWSFGAQFFRGEDASGIWTLDIINADGDGAVLNDFTIDWYGSLDGAGGFSTADDTFHFTDEIFARNIFDASTSQLTSIADDAARTTLTDVDGGTDWLDMAAMTGNLDVSLADLGTGTSSGQAFLTIAAGADIENAVGGDGNDILSGNDLDNMLLGMRGNDDLSGLDGADTLNGGTGNDRLSGGLGADVFVFDNGFGTDTITDFAASGAEADLIDFRNLDEANDFATVISGLTDTGGGAVYDLGGDGQNVLVFQGVNMISLSEDDFLFA